MKKSRSARKAPIRLGSHVTHPAYGPGVIVAREGRKAHITIIDRQTGDTMTLTVKTASLKMAA